jgi:peptidoglycan/xylan/chitin deacetylase (PgdA/CDA1 family)
MATWRERAIETGMAFFRASGAHQLAAPLTRGLGAILAFHRVRPKSGDTFAPNAGLEITPAFLDALLAHSRAAGYDILPLDEVVAALRAGVKPSRPFVALTFDDGYRDLVDYALPILERHRAPFTAYLTTGFANHTARLWWIELEEALRRLRRVDARVGDRRVSRPCATAQEKSDAFDEIYWAARTLGESELLDVVSALSGEAGVEARKLTKQACLGWPELGALARHELVTIGAHSVSHARLAKLSPDAARREMAESRDRLAAEIGVTVRHFCYPVGDVTSAGEREFALAAELGFDSGVTTRPGMIFAEHKRHLLALPRLSVNGRHQNLPALEILLSGAPFALINRGRRVAA